MDVKRRKSIEEGEEDAFSKLTEDLLCHILSFLTTKEAAVTSVLSKRWRDLFTLIPSLDLDDSIFVLGERSEECERSSFKEFVNRVLALQSNSHMTKFSIRCHNGVDEKLVEDWVVKALRRGATDLSLVMLFPLRLLYSPTRPSSTIFFNCQNNLIKLRLGCGSLGRFRQSLFRKDLIFTKLKTLHLDSIDFGRNYDAGFDKLLSKCPVLEELIVNCIRWHYWKSASVSSPTLKRLIIDCEHYLPKVYPLENPGIIFQCGCVNPRDVSFDCPNLLYLDYSEFVARNYPLIKLDSLVEAKLDVGSNITQMTARDSDEFQVRWDATNLIMGIHNVQTLHLTSDTLEVISDFCKTVPVFHNLSHLSIQSGNERGWQAMPLLLRNCPILQTLIFYGLHHGVTDGCGDACDCIPPSSLSSSCLSSCPVKILKILDFGATCKEMSLAKHFLKKLPQLEHVTIVLHLDSSQEDDLAHSEVSKAMEIAPRASHNCKLEVVS